jgi:hypothetical protein
VTKTGSLRFALAIACATVGGIAATPAAANSSAAEYFRARATSTNVPALLSNSEKEYYEQLFRAIDRENWSEVDSLLAQRADGPLHQVAKAEYYLHANSPKVEADKVRTWLSAGTDLPQAERLNTLGQKRGLDASYDIPREQSFVSQAMPPSGSCRARCKTVRCHLRFVRAYSTRSRMTIPMAHGCCLTGSTHS